MKAEVWSFMLRTGNKGKSGHRLPIPEMKDQSPCPPTKAQILGDPPKRFKLGQQPKSQRGGPSVS